VLRTGFVAGGVIGQGTNLTVSDLPFSDTGVKTFARIGRLSGNTSVNAITMQYSMESQDCYRFVDKIVTLSFYYRTGANFSGTSISTAIRTGTGIDEAMRGTFTGNTVSGTIASNPSTSWQKITLTCTLGTNINQIGLDIRYTPTGTAGTNDYFDITGVQLELGSVATPFEVRPYPVELQLCQRYYQNVVNWHGIIDSSSQIGINAQFIVEMRIAPYIVLKNAGAVLNFRTPNADNNVSTWTLNAPQSTSVSVWFQAMSVSGVTLPANGSYIQYRGANVNSIINVSSEL